jgi:hypothetical protein
MAANKYHLTPLPTGARTRVGWVALCFVGLIISPFVGFAIHGKVDGAGLSIGLLIAIVPICGLVALVALRWRRWRALPANLIEEQKFGRIFPAEDVTGVVSPIRFLSKNKKDWIEMGLEGVTMPRHTLLRMQGVPDLMAKAWITEQTGEQFVAWSEISEWVVDSDSDGPNFYFLKLQTKGGLSVRRFKPNMGSESDLLDTVRSVGERRVRIRCNVD